MCPLTKPRWTECGSCWGGWCSACEESGSPSHYDPISPAGYNRIKRWAQANGLRCPPESMISPGLRKEGSGVGGRSSSLSGGGRCICS